MYGFIVDCFVVVGFVIVRFVGLIVGLLLCCLGFVFVVCLDCCCMVTVLLCLLWFDLGLIT